ncbi:MAG: hypothetical protein ACLFVB_05145, partial [Thermoplasmata archaeon]
CGTIAGELAMNLELPTRKLLPLRRGGCNATETLGIKALMEKIKEKHEINCQFISSKTPL